MKFRSWYVCLLFLVCAGCVAQTVNEVNPVGSFHQNSIEFRGLSIPLPEGNWEVIGLGKREDGNFDEMVLGVMEGKTPVKVLLITRDSLKNHYIGYYTNKYLKRTNVLFVEVEKNKQDYGLDGWLINHYRPAFNEGAEAIKETYEYVVANKIVLPGNFIESYHVFSGKRKKNKYLAYSYLINPEAQGFDAPRNAEWGSSDWNILKINSDPKKVAYIEAFKKENAELHLRLREVFTY